MQGHVRPVLLSIIIAGVLLLTYSCATGAGKSADTGETAEKSEEHAPEPTVSDESVGTVDDGISETAAEPVKKAKADTTGAVAEEEAYPEEAAAEIAAEDFGKEEAPRGETALTTPEPVYLSADDSNSAASPVIARQLIRSGKYVHPDLVRTYEFLNYYTFSYKAAEKGRVRIVPQMRKKRGEENVYSLQIAVRGEDRDFSEAMPFQFTLLLDVSGSMAGKSYELATNFIISLGNRLKPRDSISLIVFNRDAETLGENLISGLNPGNRLTELLAATKPTDVTHLESGILLAYTLAEEFYSGSKLNRVLVISDGGANAGETSEKIIGKYAEDSDKQGIYLAGIGMGEGFNDSMMDTLTDKGRGAYLFIDSPEEIDRILSKDAFLSNFDLAVKDVRLKMRMPPGWEMAEFHGEQMSTKASEVAPQYLAPGDQMIYHMDLKTVRNPEKIGEDTFTFEVEYTPLRGRAQKAVYSAGAGEMLRLNKEIIKGDAVVAYAEMLKKVRLPLEEHSDSNTAALEECMDTVKTALIETGGDSELEKIIGLLETYKLTLQFGEQLGNTLDKKSDTPEAALGISPNNLLDTKIEGHAADKAIKVLSRLLDSTRLVPQEGYRFLALSSGPVGSPNPAGTGDLTGRSYPDPAPAFLGYKRHDTREKPRVFDRHQITFELKAPLRAKSFSFDFNFFSAEYPEYVQQNFNDTFYAIIQAESTNQGAPTNISFDPNNNSIEVDNNYFQNPFHPIPNTGTGFDRHGSTGWLRTSWPINGGEEFNLTFSIHDEGDGIYDSLVILDNFAFHEYEAVGTTDPLN